MHNISISRVRLQQLERESEDLDQSFQAYLRRQQISKQQMNVDASKIWKNYSTRKAALAQLDKTDDNLLTVGTSQPFKIDQVFNSTFYDDVDIADVLKDLNEIRRLKSPQFNKNEAFPKDSLLAQKSYTKSFEPLIDHGDKWFEKFLMEEKPANLPLKLLQSASKVTDIEFSESNRKRQQLAQNGKRSGNIEIEKPKVNGIAVYNNGARFKSKENREMEKQVDAEEKINSEMQDEKNKIVERSEKVRIETNAQKIPETPVEKNDIIESHRPKLTNGHGIEKTTEKDSNEVTKMIESKKETDIIFSPLKINGFSKPAAPIVSLLENQTTIPVSNGLKKPSEILVTNGFGAKSMGFSSKVSDSDSVELESEQISIGQQRLIKSPDDFWI